MLRGLLVTGLLGCGHIGFDPITDGSPDLPGAAPWRLAQTADMEGDTTTGSVCELPSTM